MNIDIGKYIDAIYEYNNSIVDWSEIDIIKKEINKILEKIQEIITKFEDNSLCIDGVDTTSALREYLSTIYDDYQKQQLEFIKITNKLKTIYSKVKQG